MKKKILEFIFAFTFIILCGFNAKADGLQTTRLGGQDRFETNEKIVQQGWEKSDYAIIVSGEGFADALSAAPLAKKYNAPIILSCNIAIDPRYSNLYPGTINELKRLEVKKVFIIGGTGVLSNAVESKIKDLGIDTERLCGANRYSTSIAVANKIGTSNGIILTTGDDYTDALSIAPIAGKLQMPIMLSQKDALDSIQKKFVSNNTIPKAYILGGTDIISDNVASKFSNVKRIAKEHNKYSRNLDIATTFKNDMDFSNTILASGEGFADALSGSALAALNGNPIILVGNGSNSYYITDLLANNNTKNIFALGLYGSIDDDTLNSIVNKTNALNTVKSKIKLNSNLRFVVIGTYSYDGSNYHRIRLYRYDENLKDTVVDSYQYDFLVDMQTGDAYKIDNATNKISLLDITSIGI
ncbi:cell wall-binding repeat-containing protein [Clostridium botulinum]|uniref:cell wall-binding repeat-containing protein n=1 Tax=Clostridium botulinum TaxID=1491 RepID=UPI0017495418|nr:cell wall-binding repeat-containing protein [Clostridium botulinum]MBD5572401.1 cell wall-binding repeat-containing protein [Clostridium botulinum]